MMVTLLWLVRSPSHPHSPHMRWVPMKGAFCVHFNLGNLTRAPGHPGGRVGLGAFGGRTVWVCVSHGVWGAGGMPVVATKKVLLLDGREVAESSNKY